MSSVSKCVLSAVVLIAGLALGREVLRWWAVDDVSSGGPSLGSVAGGLGDVRVPHRLQLGDRRWSLVRQSFVGSRKAAAEALRASCVAMTKEAAAPDDPPDTTERNFLDEIARRTPAAQKPGAWRVYELDLSPPMAVGVRQPPGAAGDNLAALGYRVVTWAMAVPTAKQTWTLWTFQSGGPGPETFLETPEITLPPNSRRLLSLGAGGGPGMVLFEGGETADADEWMGFYDWHFRSKGWRAAVAWRRSASGWYARYVPPEGAKAGPVDVRLSRDGNGGITGLLLYQ
jgi:hypothetical protein